MLPPLLLSGIIAGLLAGLLGIGGGIVIVPALFFVFTGLGVSHETVMSVAVATSLTTIVPTSLSSIRAHAAQNNVDTQLVKAWSPFVLAGSLVGSSLIAWLRSDLFTLIFIAVAVYAASRMLLKPAGKVADELPSPLLQRCIASVIAAVASVAGIGGGALVVPFLTAFGVQARRAIGAGAVFGLLVALPSAINLLFVANTPADAPVGTYGMVNWVAVLVIVPLTVTMAPLGVKLGTHISPLLLKRIFGCCLLVMSGRMLFQVLGQ